MKMEHVRAVEDAVLFKTHTLTAAESGVFGLWGMRRMPGVAGGERVTALAIEDFVGVAVVHTSEEVVDLFVGLLIG